MSARGLEDVQLVSLQRQLKALGNRYAMEILAALSPQTGKIVPTLGWEEIVEGILLQGGLTRPALQARGEKTQQQIAWEAKRKKLISGGTLYESMNKLADAGFVQTTGARGKKQRKFMITHQGRLALRAAGGMWGSTDADTEIQKAAKILLRHKNFLRLLPAQEKFIREVGEVEGNFMILMPPGSGKTFLAMITILIRLQRGIRCLYLSPYTSLNRQVIDEYGKLFENLGYKVARHDGQHRANDEELKGANLVIGIYESVLLAVLQNKAWINGIGLAVIDELTELDSFVSHIQPRNLGTDRSTRLDCLITLLRPSMQILTLSSRFGETGEVAGWLNAAIFRPEVRLTPDEFMVIREEQGVEIVSSDGTQGCLVTADKLIDAVFEHLGDDPNKSVLIVVGYREGTEVLSEYLADKHPRPIEEHVVTRIFSSGEVMPRARKLEATLSKGIAFHHAGLTVELRERLERAIRNGSVKTVVSTTGITSGASFPFDCVVIIFDGSMGFLVARSRYLQIAGRIGEYHLAQYGGRVYIVFEGPSRQFSNPESLEDTLLHRPLEPLNPGMLYPTLAASLMERVAATKKVFKRETVKSKFLQLAGETFRASVDSQYMEKMEEIFDTMFLWYQKVGAIEAVEKGLRLTKETRSAVKVGFNIIEYYKVRESLLGLKERMLESDLVDIVLAFSIPQSIRPRTVLPSDIEMQMTGIDRASDRYVELVRGRREIKKQALIHWINELGVSSIIEGASENAKKMSKGRERASGSDIDEGDLVTLVRICSDLAQDLGQLLKSVGRRRIAKRMELFSRQLRYGVRLDLAGSNLMELELHENEEGPARLLSRAETRILNDRGYKSISDVVRKDIDSSKRGLARNRFAKNSGLEPGFAKELYKAALSHIRAEMPERFKS
ncbi:MAG: DEAD/DEAH box helicase [Candidatus Thorarchaeota archaeon]